MSIWMIYCLLTLMLWGITGLTLKLATNHISVELALIYNTAGFVAVAVGILFLQPVEWKLSAMAWFLGILGGVLNGLGTLTILAAYHHGGKASVVTPFAALYPLVTVVLAVSFLHEKISYREVVGIVLALAATVALSYEGENVPSVPDPGRPLVTDKEHAPRRT